MAAAGGLWGTLVAALYSLLAGLFPPRTTGRCSEDESAKTLFILKRLENSAVKEGSSPGLAFIKYSCTATAFLISSGERVEGSPSTNGVGFPFNTVSAFLHITRLSIINFVVASSRLCEEVAS
jgi:hypothetical protein